MIKKLFISAPLLLGLATTVSAQLNIQLHRDFGRHMYSALNANGDRPLWTSTVEDFITDKWHGSTYFFVDMDYNNNGVASAYWEISHEFAVGKKGFAAHIEYNGGNGVGYYVNNAYLLGAAYNYNTPDYNAGFSFQAMYKYIQKNDEPNNFQFTAVWYLNFAKGLFRFDGFADLWREKNAHSRAIFISEPQIWFNLNKVKGVDKDFNLSFGSELEISKDFAGRDGWYFIPTAAVKWTFK